MFGKLLIILAFSFCSVFTLNVNAQTNLGEGHIPADLLITLNTQHAWGGGNDEMTISAEGDLSFKSSGGFPIKVDGLSAVTLDGKPANTPKYIKPTKISEKKLKSLIAEFEKIHFFWFGKNFPLEDSTERWFITDMGKEIITIRINGQTKTVTNDLGDTGKRSRLLKDLAEKIRGVAVWTLQDGEIPENFQLWYQTNNAGKIQEDFKITANGEVTKSFFSYKISEFNSKKLLPVLVKTKIVGKLSKNQLIHLIDEFEKVGFSAFRYSKLNEHDGCANKPVDEVENRTFINVQINHKSQMFASLYKNCNPKPETNAAKFVSINNVIRKLLKDSNLITLR